MGTLDLAPATCAKCGFGNGAGTLRSPRFPNAPEARPPTEEAMSRTELQPLQAGSSAYTRIGPQRGRLREAALRFAQTTEAGDAARGSWLAEVGAALDGLEAAWAEHVAFTEGRDGLFEELLLDDPVEVAPEVDHLRRDHEVVAAHVARARELLAAADAGPDDPKVLLALCGIAKQVDQHRRRGADLLYQVYSVDVAGGD